MDLGGTSKPFSIEIESIFIALESEIFPDSNPDGGGHSIEFARWLMSWESSKTPHDSDNHIIRAIGEIIDHRQIPPGIRTFPRFSALDRPALTVLLGKATAPH